MRLGAFQMVDCMAWGWLHAQQQLQASKQAKARTGRLPQMRLRHIQPSHSLCKIHHSLIETSQDMGYAPGWRCHGGSCPGLCYHRHGQFQVCTPSRRQS